MENDKEVNNGSYTTPFRSLDARIGRWRSVDPADNLYYSWSPYNLSLNNPITNSDPTGATVTPMDDMSERVWAYYVKLNAKRPEFTLEIELLEDSDVEYRIHVVDPNSEELLSFGDALGSTSLLRYTNSDNHVVIDVYLAKHSALTYTGGSLTSFDEAHQTEQNRGDHLTEIFSDEIEHMLQFERGMIGFGLTGSPSLFDGDFERGGGNHAINVSYDFDDELDSWDHSWDAMLNRCVTPSDAISDWGSLYGTHSPGLKLREAQARFLNGIGYDLDPNAPQRTVRETLAVPEEIEKLKRNGVERVLYREDGQTLIENIGN